MPSPLPNLSHIHPKDRPCAFCLIKEGKDVPPELLVAFTPRPLPAPRRRLTREARDIAERYLTLPIASRWTIARLLNYLTGNLPDYASHNQPSDPQKHSSPVLVRGSVKSN